MKPAPPGLVYDKNGLLMLEGTVERTDLPPFSKRLDDFMKAAYNPSRPRKASTRAKRNQGQPADTSG